MSLVAWIAVILGGGFALSLAGYVGYRAGLFIGESRGFHECMKRQSQYEDDEN